MFRPHLTTGVAELLSRGALWARILLLGALMPVDGYGYVLVLLGIEGLLTATLSYPSIKDILVRQDLSLREFRRFSLLFLIALLPVVALLAGLADYGWRVITVVTAAAYLAAATQIGLYMLRVADLSAHNRVKLAWSAVTTVLFLCLLPLHWAFLPMVYAVGFLPILWGVVVAIRATKIGAAFDADLGHHIRGGLIYGTQALINNFPQHGVRLFVAATMTLADVALYTQTYMLATALFFVYSTVMIVFEPRLSRASSGLDLRGRIPLAGRLSILFIALACIYMFAMLYLTESGILSTILPKEIRLDILLFSALMVYIGLNGVYTIVNSLVLAVSGRAISLLSSILSLIVIVGGLAMVFAHPRLFEIGIIFGAAQFISLLTLGIFLILSVRSEKYST